MKKHKQISEYEEAKKLEEIKETVNRETIPEEKLEMDVECNCDYCKEDRYEEVRPFVAKNGGKFFLYSVIFAGAALLLFIMSIVFRFW